MEESGEKGKDDRRDSSERDGTKEMGKNAYGEEMEKGKGDRGLW